MLFNKGSDALQRENYDYAVALFNQVLEKEPTVYECRKALRTAQQHKAGGGGGLFKKGWSFATSSPGVTKAQMALRKNPAEALQLAEHVLNSDPNSSGAHRVAAQAAMALELPRTAAMSLEILMKNSPKDKDLAIEFASALAGTGEAGRAEKILQDLVRLLPNDPDLAQALKNVTASKTLSEGGYEKLADGQGSYRDILRNEGEAVALEQEQRVVKTEDLTERLIQEYEARLPNEPKNLKLLRSLAELYTQKKQFDRALRYYEQINVAEGSSDPTLERSIADTVLRRFDHQLSLLDPAAPDYAEKAAKVQAEKQAYQLDECRKRAEKYPTDLQIRFELGQLYFEAGKISEAIQEFQKAQANPNRRLAAMSCLGQCFAKRGMNDLAARTIQNALKEKQVFDEEKKDLIYLLGCVLENMGKKEEAIEQFKLIYEVDIGFKDVAAKVDAYYAGK
jgi:tetratricopeptide (TPR) repeat protein